MSPRISKSTNLDIYPYFFKYDDPSEIPYVRLAKKLDLSPNKLRGMIRPARHNSTIYSSLLKMGYKDHQIPGWFARPDKRLVYRRAAPAGPQVSAGERSSAESSDPITGYSLPTRDVVQEGSAERPSELSMRSAPPANVYRQMQPEYRPPLNPIIEEALRQIRETQDEELKASLERSKRKRGPRKPMSLGEIKARAEALTIMQQINARNATKVKLVWDLMNQGTGSERLDIEEIKKEFTKHHNEMEIQNERAREERKDTIDTGVKLLRNLMPNKGPSDDFIRKSEIAAKKKEKDDREAWVDLFNLVTENREQNNIDLEMIGYRGKKIWEEFYKTINQMHSR